MPDKSDFIDRVGGLNIYRRGSRRAPHKPLLLLYAIGELLRGNNVLSFEAVENAMKPLLEEYAPPVKSRHQPELPYWHLRNDGLWVVRDAATLPKRKDDFPSMSFLRETEGHLHPDFAKALTQSAEFTERVVRRLLQEHFAEGLHDELRFATGLEEVGLTSVAANSDSKRKRDPRFRRNVLLAYEHRCAVTGFRAALGGRFFGCEAAHVQWHAFGGPDGVENGIALEPTMHTLLDKGAWTLTDNRQVLVSAEFTGSDAAVDRLRSYHGRHLRKPLPGSPRVSTEFIRWHRDADKGGVFRQPALAL